jgi:type IV secretion system protein VirD4
MSNVHFILDEAASLQHLDCIDDALALGRGYGIRLQFYFQSCAQAKKNFPDGQEQTLFSNTTQVFFAVNDQQTAELVSSRLGEYTAVVASGGTSSGRSNSVSSGAHGSSSSGGSSNSSSNWQQQARKLLKPEEVIALSQRTAITFTPGLPPICTTLIRYYEEKLDRSRFQRFATAAAIFVLSAILCVLSLSFAAGLSDVNQPARRPMPARFEIGTPLSRR